MSASDNTQPTESILPKDYRRKNKAFRLSNGSTQVLSAIPNANYVYTVGGLSGYCRILYPEYKLTNEFEYMEMSLIDTYSMLDTQNPVSIIPGSV